MAPRKIALFKLFAYGFTRSIYSRASTTPFEQSLENAALFSKNTEYLTLSTIGPMLFDSKYMLISSSSPHRGTEQDNVLFLAACLDWHVC